MTRTLKLYSGEDQSPIVDLTDLVEWPDSEFAHRAHLGEGSLSRIRFRDEDGRVGNSSDLPAGLTAIPINAHNVVVWQESGVTMGRMRISPKDWTRGEQVAGRAREAEISLDDYNADLHKIIVHGWERPAETDKARVQVLVAQYLSGSPRRTTNLNGSNYVSSSNTITLPATTYNRTTTNEVLASIAAAANKQYFVTVDGSLFYDGNDSTAYASPFKISDRDTDLSSTVFAPQPGGFGPASSEDGQQLLSGIWLFYGESLYVHVTNPTVANQNSWWEDIVYDDTVVDATQATVVANAILAQRQDEERQIAVRIGPLEVGQAILLKAGQLIQIKWRAIPNADDAYVTRRISELRWTTPEPFSFFADMILDRPTKLHGSGQKTDTVIPKTAPGFNPDTLGSTIYSWTWTTNENDDQSSTYDAGLQRSTTGWGLTYFSPAWGENNASHYQSVAIPASANTAYGFSCDIAWKYKPSVRNVDIVWKNGPTVLRTDRWITGAGHSVNTKYAESGTFTSPASTNTFLFAWSHFAGQFVDNLFFSTAGTAAVNDPYALVDSGTSPYFARTDDPRFDADDQHSISSLTRRMFNNSGVALIQGNVVVPDLTLENAVTRTTTANSTAAMVGVILEDAAAGTDTLVMWQGTIESVVSTDTTPTAGDYLYTSTTAGQSQTSATRSAGAVGRIINVTGTEQTVVLWWGIPDAGSGGSGVATDTIWDAKGDLAAGTAADTAAKLTVGANDTVLMADSGQTAGLKWVASGTPSTQAFGDSAAEGTTDGYARTDHKHAMPADPVSAASSLASGTGDVTTTASLQDLTGATLSLTAGTYIIHATYDVEVNNASNDRLFEGHLDSGGSDQNDIALLLATGWGDADRVTVSQSWRLVLGSTTTVKLRALHSGGTVGDFDVKAANTTIAAYRAGGGGESTNLTGAYDIEGDGSPAYTDAGMSDEFETDALDAQWTAVGASEGTASLTTANPAASVYDPDTRTKGMLVQVDIAGSVSFRIDDILTNGEQIIASISIASPGDATQVGNSQWVGLGVNDNDTDYDSGTWRAVFWDGGDSNRIIAHGSAGTLREVQAIGSTGVRSYFRILMTGGDLHYYHSFDGTVWSPLGSESATGFTNVWVFFDGKGISYDNAPIHCVNWVRHVANTNFDPW